MIYYFFLDEMTNKYDERFQVLIEEYDEKLEKTKKPKKLKFEYEDKIVRLFKSLISKSCCDDFEPIFSAYKNCMKNFTGEEETE